MYLDGNRNKISWNILSFWESSSILYGPLQKKRTLTCVRSIQTIFWNYSARLCEAHWPVQCLSVRLDMESVQIEYHQCIILYFQQMKWMTKLSFGRIMNGYVEVFIKEASLVCFCFCHRYNFQKAAKKSW